MHCRVPACELRLSCLTLASNSHINEKHLCLASSGKARSIATCPLLRRMGAGGSMGAASVTQETLPKPSVELAHHDN